MCNRLPDMGLLCYRNFPTCCRGLRKLTRLLWVMEKTILVFFSKFLFTVVNVCKAFFESKWWFFEKLLFLVSIWTSCSKWVWNMIQDSKHVWKVSGNSKDSYTTWKKHFDNWFWTLFSKFLFYVVSADKSIF